MDYQQKILDKFYGVEEKVNNTRENVALLTILALIILAIVA